MDTSIVVVKKKAEQYYNIFAKKCGKWLLPIVYTILFFAVFFLSFNTFLRDKVSLVNVSDGIAQHYPSIMYVGRYYREIVNNFLHGNFIVPMFDFNLGMGSDITQTFHYYGLGDPLLLISAFVPESSCTILYNILVVVRFYLSGFAFLYMCRYFNKRESHSLIGALIYVFCGFSLISFRHPYFLNPVIYLPLLIVGVDKVLNRKGYWLFIVMTAVSAVSNFYFFYMLTICIFIYAIVRVWDIVEENIPKNLFVLFCRCASFYVVGLMLAAFMFVPSVIGFLNSGRSLEPLVQDLLHYQVEYYVYIALKYIVPTDSWSCLGMSAISLISLILLFSQKDKKYRTLKILFVVCEVFLLIPFFSYMMNGFGYVSTRWTFAFALLASYLVVEMLPKLFQITKKQNIAILGAILLYVMVCVISRSYANFYGLAMLATIYMVLLLCQESNNSLRFLHPELVCLAVVCANIILGAHILFSTSFQGYEKEFVKSNKIDSIIANTPANAALPLNEKEFCRVSMPDENGNVVNNPIIQRYPGISSYYSLVNESFCNLRLDHEIINGRLLFRILGCDSRTILETLCSTKYFCKDSTINLAPYGFEKMYEKVRKDSLDKSGDIIVDTVYKNKFSLPLGYTYSKSMSEEQFKKLSVMQRQEAMLDTVALSKESEKPMQISFDSKKLDATIENSEGACFENGKLKVTKANSSINIRFNGLPNSETYIRFKDLICEKRGLSAKIFCGDTNKTIETLAMDSQWYAGQDKCLLNLGYNELPMNSIEIVFPKTFEFSLSDIEVYCMPMTNYASKITSLAAEPMRNTVVSTNKITGYVDLSTDKILCISIPYSSGWNATVDGKNVEILRANNVFMAIKLPRGHHDIVLSYSTPLAGASCIVSIVTVLVIAIYLVVKKRK